ncbi:four-helix bundle copper-binding protein [Deinococcus sp. Arct2-2]|uniref:four-helix bundle copper-binding protein n=1 Tax=Deinococcus sp. Arct2-2 TaxID=2568653 RepID=UPI0010A4CFEC|nr:four-helix bundle copper-binding protein [Deinococcus sp. Arct2-2]THF68356.1 four-helix bundle copper-binding protein [Deinococcus sp. Arct2-2]
MTQNTTSAVTRMLQTHPQIGQPSFDLDRLMECIQACFECVQVCTSCADACLGETEHAGHLTHCIRLNADCADICDTTGRVLMRQTQPDMAVIRAQLQSCLVACKACGDECQQHAENMGMKHCEVCMESCRRCEQACQKMLDGLSA